MSSKKTNDGDKRKKRKRYAKPKLRKHGLLSLNVADAYY